MGGESEQCQVGGGLWPEVERGTGGEDPGGPGGQQDLLALAGGTQTEVRTQGDRPPLWGRPHQPALGGHSSSLCLQVSWSSVTKSSVSSDQLTMQEERIQVCGAAGGLQQQE